MIKKTKQFARQQVYFPKEIPDTLTPEIERSAREAKTREYNERIEDIKRLHSIKQQQIQGAKEDRHTHAINTIIEWTESGKRTIPYLSFNFYYEEQQVFAQFLNKLKEAKCFSDWSTNPYKDAYHSEYSFKNVNITALHKYNEHKNMSQNKIPNLPKTQASFDPILSKINLSGNTVPIPKNTDQFDLCNAIFKNSSSKQKEWSFDEMFEEWGSNFELSQWRKVYNAAREINQKVAAKTMIDNLLLVTTKTVQLNPSYL